MALTGHLSDLSLSELIEFFCNQRKTGQLKVLYPQGPGYFYLQTGSVIDARIGVLRGIDAVYYALTLPNAKFEFSGSDEASERTINQPWTQVVLEGLRRLDEGIEPHEAFPDSYMSEEDAGDESDLSDAELHNSRAPAFLSFLQPETIARRKFFVIGAVMVAVLAIVGVIGVPAGWYSRSTEVSAAVSEQPEKVAEAQPTPVVEETTPTPTPEPEPSPTEDPAVAARKQRERDRARLQAEKNSLAEGSVRPPTTTTPPPIDNAKGGAKRVTVTVTYDESGRVTQASGGDATAVRIARQKRFPAGKAGSATITIPIN
jgi:Domain of unknown function (DUF4388)